MTTYVTSILLVGGRIVNSIYVSSLCQKQNMAQSVNLVEQVTFNTVGAMHRAATAAAPAALRARPNALRHSRSVRMWYGDDDAPPQAAAAEPGVAVGTVV